MKKILKTFLVLALVIAIPIGAAMAGDAQKVTGTGIVHAESEGLWIGDYPANTWSKEGYEFDEINLKYQQPDTMKFWVKNETKGNKAVQYKLYSENISDTETAGKIDVKITVSNTDGSSSNTICDTTLATILSPDSENCTFEMDQQGNSQNNIKKVSIEMSLNVNISNDIENFKYDLAIEEYEEGLNNDEVVAIDNTSGTYRGGQGSRNNFYQTITIPSKGEDKNGNWYIEGETTQITSFRFRVTPRSETGKQVIHNVKVKDSTNTLIAETSNIQIAENCRYNMYCNHTAYFTNESYTKSLKKREVYKIYLESPKNKHEIVTKKNNSYLGGGYYQPLGDKRFNHGDITMVIKMKGTYR